MNTVPLDLNPFTDRKILQFYLCSDVFFGPFTNCTKNIAFILIVQEHSLSHVHVCILSERFNETVLVCKKKTQDIHKKNLNNTIIINNNI